jgi:hypothetical protein
VHFDAPTWRDGNCGHGHRHKHEQVRSIDRQYCALLAGYTGSRARELRLSHQRPAASGEVWPPPLWLVSAVAANGAIFHSGERSRSPLLWAEHSASRHISTGGHKCTAYCIRQSRPPAPPPRPIISPIADWRPKFWPGWPVPPQNPARSITRRHPPPSAKRAYPPPRPRAHFPENAPRGEGAPPGSTPSRSPARRASGGG